MKTKQEIVENWLPRYTGRPLNDFTQYILLTNFQYYIDLFSKWNNVPIVGENHKTPALLVLHPAQSVDNPPS